uniref:Uncharacterized protein n=1 Tax=Odontella aurita TaxID=265563 RepID=A0A7S4MAG0_9STRA
MLMMVPPLAMCPSSSWGQSARPTGFPNSVPVLPADLDVLVRQTGQAAPTRAAIGLPSTCRCRHGFPQAFALDPLPAGSGRANSGLLKLTCPHLVNAVDDLEDDGGIVTFNERLAVCPPDGVGDEERRRLRNSAAEAHTVHASMRRDMLSSNDDLEALCSKLGERGAEAFLGSGVAGAAEGTFGSDDGVAGDVKCLHAWLADYLFRGLEGDSALLGSAVGAELEMRGIDLNGTAACNAACDPCFKGSNVPPPPKPRNKQRLRTGKEIARRRRRREEEKARNM